MPETKDYVSVTNEVHKQNFCTCERLCNLQDFFTGFKEKHPNVNTGFSKLCNLRPKWCVLAGLKMIRSVCVCTDHQNVLLLFDWVIPC